MVRVVGMGHVTSLKMSDFDNFLSGAEKTVSPLIFQPSECAALYTQYTLVG